MNSKCLKIAIILIFFICTSKAPDSYIMDPPYDVNGVKIAAVDDLNSPSHDAVIIVISPQVVPVHALEDFIASALQIDQGLNKAVGVLSCPRVAGGRLIVSPTGPLTPYDDVRSFSEAAHKGVERAMQAGSKNPILVIQPNQCENGDLVMLLAAFEALYVPIQIRELFPEKKTVLESMGVYGEGLKRPFHDILKTAVALEKARLIARDIGGGDPERMTPGRVLEYVRRTFNGTDVNVRALEDHKILSKEYPLWAAVDRAARSVDRHKGLIIFLEYTPKSYDKTVMLVGKGVTYDTGGADIKAGGVMAGMSRDKCGAAAVAGFLKACDLLKPDIKVIGAMSMVRNSVGEEAYVADELIVSRNGKVVRVGNTDAEGRMIMADLLAEMHEKALKEKNPHVYTIATLTGHAHRAVGDGYTIVMDNHAARYANHAMEFQKSGDSIGDMVEISTIRREDLKVHRGQGRGDDVHQALNKASTQVPRGHQGPAGFLLLTSGLDDGFVKYSHLDIAASSGSLPDEPTGAPVLALASLYKLFQL